jgi:hypothetical protein
MQHGHRRTVVLDQATSEKLARAREKLSYGSIKPTEASILREAIARGLPSLMGDGTPPTSKPTRAA